MSSRRLSLLDPSKEGLGVGTIMDRALAVRHGVRYVHAAAFAIDVDRVRAEAGDNDPRPLGWEVYLTGAYLEARFDPRVEADFALIEELCVTVLERCEHQYDQPPLGSQLPFAIYAAVDAGRWPRTLRAFFRAWKHRPKELLNAVEEFRQDPEFLPVLAASCLKYELDPPAPPPTRQSWIEMAERRFTSCVAGDAG